MSVHLYCYICLYKCTNYTVWLSELELESEGVDDIVEVCISLFKLHLTSCCVSLRLYILLHCGNSNMHWLPKFNPSLAMDIL